MINLPLGGVALYFAWTALPVTPLISREFDRISTLLLAVGLGALVFGLDSFAHSGGVVIALALLLIGGGSLVVLVGSQLGKADPAAAAGPIGPCRFPRRLSDRHPRLHRVQFLYHLHCRST